MGTGTGTGTGRVSDRVSVRVSVRVRVRARVRVRVRVLRAEAREYGLGLPVRPAAAVEDDGDVTRLGERWRECRGHATDVGRASAVLER